MFTYQIAPGSTDVSVTIRIIDSTDGTPETGVVFNTSGIDLEYRRSLAASTDITEATLAALTTAHTDGGFLHIGNGYYRLDLPDAAVATGAAECLVHGTVTGMVVIGCVIQLDGYANVQKIYSDTTIATSKTTQIYSDTTIATSKTTQIYSDTTAIHTQTTTSSSKAVQIYSDTTIAVSKETRVLSDTTHIDSDTTHIESDAARVESKVVQIYSDTTIATSKTTQIYSDTTAIHTQTTTSSSKAVQIYSDSTRIHSDTTYLTGPGDGTAGAFPEWGIIDQGTAQSATATTIVLRSATPFGSDDANLGATILALGSDQGYWQARLITDYTTADDTATVETWDVTPSGTITYKIFGTPPASASSGSLTAAQDSKLTRVNSKATQIYSDTAITSSKAVQVYSDTTIATSKTTQIYSDTTRVHSDTTHIDSDTTHIESDTARAESKAVQIYSDTTIVTSKTTQIYSDTTAIHTQTTTASSKAVQIYSDTTIAVSRATQIYSDTTAVHSDTTAVQTKTDSLTFTQAGHVDANVQRINDVTITGDGAPGTEFGV